MLTQSPFPGMDPYLEWRWRDIHHRLMTYSCDHLQLQLPGGLFARLEERVYLAGEEGPSRDMYPHVRITDSGRDEGVAVALETELAEPLIVEVAHEPVTETYIEIHDPLEGDAVLTVIEVLSPTNKKKGEGRVLYQQKQKQMKSSNVNLVEIDLLRAGHHTLTLPRHRMPAAARGLRAACVWRGSRPKRYEIYPMPLQRRLPVIRVPLRPTDPDVRLDLQALIELAYRNGRYGALIDYRDDPEPPPKHAEMTWINELLKTKGLR